MSDYTYSANLAAKDNLASGDSNKKILGATLETEFEAIETAIATKIDESSIYTDIDDVPKVAMFGQGWLCPHKNLVINYVSATTATVTATKILLENSSAEVKIFSSLSVTLDITGADAALGRVGVDGAAAAAEANSTWYHIWAIGKTDGTVSAVLTVASPVSSQIPSVPTGYTYYGYLGAIYNDSGSNFDEMYQKDRYVGIPLVSLVTNGTATSPTSLNSTLAAVIPPTARVLNGHATALNVGGGSGGDPVTNIYLNSAGSVYAAQIGGVNVNASALISGSYRAVLLTAQTIWYENANGTDYAATVYANGWEY